jgi:hypothetical protein
MAVFESLGETADGAVDKAKVYAKSTEAYVRLQIFKHIGVLVSLIVKGLLIGGMLLTAILYFSVSLTVALSEWLGGVAAASAVVGGLFMLFVLIIVLNSKAIDKIILVKLSKKLRS